MARQHGVTDDGVGHPAVDERILLGCLGRHGGLHSWPALFWVRGLTVTGTDGAMENSLLHAGGGCPFGQQLTGGLVKADRRAAPRQRVDHHAKFGGFKCRFHVGINGGVAQNVGHVKSL